MILIGNDYDNFKNTVEQVFHNSMAMANKTGLTLLNATGDLISDNEVKNLKDSGISGDDYSFDTTYYPYYGFLNSEEKNLYKQIYANVEELETTFVPKTTVSVEEAQDAVEAIYNDHPELFWLDTSYSYKYTKNGNCVQLIMDFNTTAKNIDTSKKRFNEKANNIISKASKLGSNYEKEKYVHDAIIQLVEYDSNASMNQSAYSALVNGRTVCAGYARSFQYIMIKLNIPTYYCTGYAGGDHAWNIIKLSDGYYNVDLTWDDSSNISYKYFNIKDSEFSKTHKRDDISTSLPTCNASAYSYKNSNSSTTKKNTTPSNHNDTNKNNSNNNTKDTNKNNNDNIVDDSNKNNSIVDHGDSQDNNNDDNNSLNDSSGNEESNPLGNDTNGDEKIENQN